MSSARLLITVFYLLMPIGAITVIAFLELRSIYKAVKRGIRKEGGRTWFRFGG